MNAAFAPRTDITNVNDLFGRRTIVSQLASLAKNNNSVAIVGLRRFGKTSILRSIFSELRKESNSNSYPIYFDFKEVGSIIKGTDNVYRFMIAKLILSLTRDRHFGEQITFKKKVITPSLDWEDTYENLADVSAVRIQGLFEELVDFFSEYMDKTILFLIDEYEWLFRFSFDEPVGFMKLRNLSSKVFSGRAVFNFWIAGANSWDYLCNITGSGELNVIDAPPIYVGGIDYEAFKEMWKFEVEKIDHCPKHVHEGCDMAFELSGGIPFYGKKIGCFLLGSNSRPSFMFIKSHLEELVEGLPVEEKTILGALANGPCNFRSSKHILELVEKGIVGKKGKHYAISFALLKDFVAASKVVANNDNQVLPESQILTDEISSLIASINNTNKNKHNTYLFEPIVDEAALLKDLRTPCRSAELFSDFASSIYKMVFERTKSVNGKTTISKGKLPESFKKNNQFIEIVDMLRHSLGGGHLMDTFIPKPGQLTKPQMLDILLGSKNEPQTADEYFQLQLAVLKRFKVELVKLNTIVRS